MKKEEYEVIEKWGIYYKRTGHQPMLGRIMAYLMIADPPHQSFEEIVDALKSSKSAISNTLTLMEHLGIIDYTRFSGDRKRYFKINPEGFSALFEKQYREVGHFRQLVEEILAVRSNKNSPIKKEIQKLQLFLTMFEKEYPAFVRKWKQEAQKRFEK